MQIARIGQNAQSKHMLSQGGSVFQNALFLTGD